MADNGAPVYRVAHLASVADEIKQAAQIAAGRGMKAVFLISLESIYQRLSQDPRKFGEYRFSWQTLEWFIGAIRQIDCH